MELRFEDPDLRQLCCRLEELRKTLGRPEAEALTQLLTELHCAQDLSQLDRLSHIHLQEEDDLVISITGIGHACVRVRVDQERGRSAVVLGVSCGDHFAGEAAA